MSSDDGAGKTPLRLRLGRVALLLSIGVAASTLTGQLLIPRSAAGGAHVRDMSAVGGVAIRVLHTQTDAFSSSRSGVPPAAGGASVASASTASRLRSALRSFERRLLKDTLQVGRALNRRSASGRPTPALAALTNEQRDLRRARRLIAPFTGTEHVAKLELRAIDLFGRALADLKAALNTPDSGKAKRLGTSGKQLANQAAVLGTRAARLLRCGHRC